MSERDAALALHHFGVGARPGEREALRAPREHLARQVGAPASFALSAAGLPTRAQAIAASHGEKDAPGVTPAGELLRAEIGARYARGLTTETGFAERLAWFWSNHFTVAVGGKTTAWVGLFEREVVRAHLTGRFEDLLLASCRHPAMLLYLDQAVSVGPGSVAGLRRERGLNENLAREILELHTLGVDGGYTQADVTELARALTGWTLVSERTERVAGGRAPGEFLFVPRMHEPGARQVLGVRAPEGGEAQAEALLRSLARHPNTARHLATKLARHFVADAPPERAIAALARAFLDSGGDLPTVHRALLDLPEAWAVGKRRAPEEFVVAALRLLDVTTPPRALLRAVEDLGQPTFRASSPAGWPDTAAAWAGPDALLRRVTWAASVSRGAQGRPDARLRDVLGPLLSEGSARAVARAASPDQGFVLALLCPEFQHR